MQACGRISAGILCGAVAAFSVVSNARADVSIGGFVPYVGIGLTDEFETFDSDPDGTFFIADPSFSWGGTPLGPGSSAYFDLALLDTGAATHILTQQAASSTGFSIQSEGFRGTNFQTIFGASGNIDLRINDPLGVYAAGLASRTGAGAALTMNTAAMRGQTSFAMLEAPAQWQLPNIFGLPVAAHHAIHIRNDQPQLFQHQGRTVRTPNIEFIDLGTGQDEGVVRHTNLKIRPSASFLQGPIYVQNFDILGGLEFHDNPLSPSVIDSGAILIEVDMRSGTRSIQDKDFLFDTGADLTVVSRLTAARLGFDVLNEEPEFILEVEGAGGVSSGVPGFYVEELNIDTIGGGFTMQNVPVAVLDLPNPNDPANIIDGILGMHVFNGRNLVIDAEPAATPGSLGPRLYISDRVTQTHSWASNASLGQWQTAENWSAADTPNVMWVANVVNVSGINQVAVVSANSTVFELSISGTPAASMTVRIEDGVTLTTFGETRIDSGGRVELGGGKLDAQFVNIHGGVLAGQGDVFAGTGPIHSAVRNLGGRIESGDPIGRLSIDGDLAQQDEGTLAIDLGGTVALTQYDRIDVSRFAFLDGILEVSLVDSGAGLFTPAVGNTFTILMATEGVQGTFDELHLPAGFTWNVMYGPNSVTLSVAGLGLAGDFNSDGAINAADYVAWRNNGATAAEYQAWRNNFGRTAPAAASVSISPGSVPEPTSWIICLAAASLTYTFTRRRPTVSRPAPCAASMSYGS